MKKTSWIMVLLICGLLCLHVDAKNLLNMFGIEQGNNQLLDQIQKKYIGNSQIETVILKTFSTVNAKEDDGREIVRKIYMKTPNMILVEAGVKFTDKPHIASQIPFTYLCDGENYWTDDNQAKKMAKLSQRPRRFTYVAMFENLIMQRATKLQSVKEVAGEYVIITDYQNSAFEYNENITYHVEKSSLLITKMVIQSMDGNRNRFEEILEFKKYLSVNNIFYPKSIKINIKLNDQWIMTEEEEIEEIKFNQNIAREVFTR